ncbi:MAG: extracellular solute-binding protein [Candidatus Omnitrophota bacterium]|nr:MAG: extracellular solute-binding protein [Candidatus Omnitrophota bacterium]
MKRIITLLFLLVFICGCRSVGKDVLRVVMGLTEEEWQVMRQDIFPLFEKEHDCRIKAYQVEAQDWVRKLEAMVSANKVTVDVFSQDNMRLYPLVAKKLVEDLTAYVDKIPSQITPSMKEVGVFRTRTYFFPYRPNVQITYYNQKKFNEYNLKPPKTWDELLKVGKRFKEAEGVGRLGLKLWGGSPTVAQVYELIVSAGGEPFEFNDQGCIDTFVFLKKLYPYLSVDSKKAKWDTTNTYLANESFYLAQNWPFGVNIIVKEYGKNEIKAYSGWRGPKREAHTVGGEVLGIPKGAKNKELALKFILFLESREVQEILVSKLGWPLVRQDAYGQIAEWQEPYFEAVEEALKEGVYRPNVLYWGDFEKFLNEAIMRILVNQEEIKPVLNQYHQKMQDVIIAYETRC